MKRIIIAHQWGGNPKGVWYPWLKKELEAKGFEVLIPEMPETGKPNIEKWVNTLSNVVGNNISNTYFIGHSVGCLTILHYLVNKNTSEAVPGVLLVAPWIWLKGLDTESKEIADPWLRMGRDLDYEKLQKRAVKYKALFSTDDEWVPIDNADHFSTELNAELKVFDNKGHFESEKDEDILKSLVELAND